MSGSRWTTATTAALLAILLDPADPACASTPAPIDAHGSPAPAPSAPNALGAALDSANFAVATLGSPGVPQPLASEKREIEAVQRAGGGPGAANLMFTRVGGKLVLYYGDPLHPDGEAPAWVEESGAAVHDGRRVARIEAYHVLGHGNLFYNPHDHETFPVLIQDAAACKGMETAGDRAVERIEHLPQTRC